MSSVAWLFMMRVAVIWQMSSRCPLSTIIMLTSAACACVPYMYQHRTARLSQLLYGVWLWDLCISAIPFPGADMATLILERILCLRMVAFVHENVSMV